MQQASNTPESPQACATFAADNIDYNHIDSGRGKALLDWLQASANSKIVHRSVCLCGCSIAWQLSFEASKVHVWQCCCGRGSYHAPWMTIHQGAEADRLPMSVWPYKPLNGLGTTRHCLQALQTQATHSTRSCCTLYML